MTNTELARIQKEYLEEVRKNSLTNQNDRLEKTKNRANRVLALNKKPVVDVLYNDSEFIEQVRSRVGPALEKIDELMAMPFNDKNMLSIIKGIELILAYSYGRPAQASINVSATSQVNPADIIRIIESRTPAGKRRDIYNVKSMQSATNTPQDDDTVDITIS